MRPSEGISAALPVLRFLIYAYGWESGERLQVEERFIYENF
jgi:hypothetical protein